MKTDVWPVRFVTLVLIGYLFINNEVAFAQTSVTFTPSGIPITQPEIINPFRGYYKWNDQERITSQVLPSVDAYKRYNWSDLESSIGNYDFSVIENDIAAASNSGQKFRFGIRALRGVDDSYYEGMHVPSYLEAYGWWLTNSSGRFFIPDWNHSYFLERAEALVTALGARYNSDPRVAAINIRLYGLYGEWHMAGVNYSSAPSKEADYCARSICANYKPVKPGNSVGAANLRRIVDMHAGAFPNKQLIMMVGQSDSSENVSDAVMYAMSKNATSNPPVSRPIGWRNECLGYVWYNSLGRYYEHFRDASAFTHWASNTYTNNLPESLLKNRWMYAPVDTEYCPISSSMISGSGSDVFLKAKQQVIDYHVSMVGNGNMDSGIPPQGKLQEAVDVGKYSGFRYALRSVTVSSPIRDGQSFIISSIWNNYGVAPTYEDWDVYFQLRAGVSVVWHSKSQIQLKKVLPTNSLGYSQNDSFVISGVPSGNYLLIVKICDPSYNCVSTQTPPISGVVRKPLFLANNGRNLDGSYSLGDVSVTTDSISPTPSLVPSADANGDGKVDGIDYLIWLKNYNISTSGVNNGDFDYSGSVNIADLVIWTNTYGN